MIAATYLVVAMDKCQSTNSSSKVTITTKEDQSFASLDSDGLMSVGAVFSEISIPKGR